MTDQRLSDEEDLPAWRSWLLDRVIRFAFALSLVPAALVTLQAVRDNEWAHAFFCWGSIALLGFLSQRSRASYTVRAVGGGWVLYLFGAWLYTRGGAVGMLYLMGLPVLMALLVGPRVAFCSMGLSAVTLTGAGWLLELPVPMVIGLPGDSLLRWVTLGSNLLLMGTVLTLATGFLLRRLERALAGHRHSAQLLREVASQVPGMVFRLEWGAEGTPRFLFVSPGSQGLLDISPQDLMDNPGLLTDRLHPEDLRELRTRIREAVSRGESHYEAQLRVHTAQGGVRWLQVQATEVDRRGSTLVLNGVATDITERKQTEATVQRQAHTDALTGLPNRLSLQKELARKLSQTQEQGGQVALLLVDLDHFKEVNDTLGHASGDALLIQAGQRLQTCLGGEGFVARVGGDEFVLMLNGSSCATAADQLGRRVLENMSRAFVVDGQQAFVAASVGVAMHPQDGADAEALLMHADQALYEAKSAGRNRCIRFTVELHARGQRRVRLAHELRSAIESRQLSLVYQPIIELVSRRVVKAEALLRWQHPELGAISPAEFVPIAESAGLIDSIGSWVLVEAAQQARRWRQTLDPQFRIGINHSPLQFRSDQPAALPWADQLAVMGLPGEALIVEITEGLLLEHSDALAEQLRQLRATGVQIALDDFGTGYSALAYLQRYEIDLLKIDRSFVSGAASGRTGRSLCRAMVALAQELGMQVVAEGVETTEQSDWLKSIGCQHAQGWLYGRGMSPAEFERWFEQHQQALAEPA